MVIAPALGVALSTSGCAGGCNSGAGYYLGNVSLPGITLDCTLTLVGPGNQATYDCPAPQAYGYAPGCSAQGSTPPLQGDSIAGQVWGKGGSYYFAVSIDDRSSWMSNYLGGSSFSLTLTCGGMTITQVQGQFGKTQYCAG